MTITEQTEEITVTESEWVAVCPVDQLHLERGAAVLVEGQPIALFLVGEGGDEMVFAVSHIDPLSGTPTMARGIVGSHDGRPFIAAPLLKERYDLASGGRIDGDGPSLPTFETRIHAGNVELRANVMPGKSA